MQASAAADEICSAVLQVCLVGMLRTSIRASVASEDARTHRCDHNEMSIAPVHQMLHIKRNHVHTMRAHEAVIAHITRGHVLSAPVKTQRWHTVTICRGNEMLECQ